MHKTPLTAVLATVLAMTAGAPVLAQPYPDDPAQQQYQDAQARYQDAQDDYADRQRAYEQQQAEWRQRRDDYERQREAYDAQWGYGAYARRYGEFDDGYARSAGAYSSDVAYTDLYAPYRGSPCEEDRSGRTVAGGVIGALAGAAIGSNIGGHGARTEGAVLGALAGGVVGANIGRSTARCDNAGYYYSYSQTYPYREAQWDRYSQSGRYDYRWYSSRGCRLAIAPTRWGDGDDYRYVRVCPDGSGRYRITG